MEMDESNAEVSVEKEARECGEAVSKDATLIRL